MGYKVVGRVKVRRLAVFYGGLMGRMDSREATKLIMDPGHCVACGKNKPSLLVWAQRQQNTELQRQLGRASSVFCRDYLARGVQRWKMTIAVASLDELLEKRMNKKHRYWAKRTCVCWIRIFRGRFGLHLIPH